MQNISFKSVFLLLIGLFLGIGGCSLFSGTNEQPANSNGKIIPPAAIVKTVVVQDAAMAKKADSLNAENRMLQQQAATAKAALQAARTKAVIAANTIQEMLSQAPDTCSAVSFTDSLSIAFTDYQGVSGQKDSACDVITTVLQDAVANRDSLIDEQQTGYNALHQSFDLMAGQQSEVAGQRDYYLKQYHRQRLKSRLLSVGLTTLAGLATYSLLHH